MPFIAPGAEGIEAVPGDAQLAFGGHTFASNAEGLQSHVSDKVEALEQLYKTDIIGTNADLEDIAAKYDNLIPEEEIEKHKEMVTFLMETIDLEKVKTAREEGQGKAADKEFTKVGAS